MSPTVPALVAIYALFTATVWVALSFGGPIDVTDRRLGRLVAANLAFRALSGFAWSLAAGAALTITVWR